MQPPYVWLELQWSIELSIISLSVYFLSQRYLISGMYQKCEVLMFC